MSIDIQASELWLLGNTTGNATGPTDVALTQNLSVSIYDGDNLERDFDGLNAGQDKTVIRTNPFNTFAWDMDGVGSGAAGTRPPADIYLEAAGFKGTETASTSVVYNRRDPNDTAPVDLEVRHLVSRASGSERDYQYKTTEALGKVGIDMVAKETALLKFTDFQGNYIRPADVTGEDPNYGTLKDNLADLADADNTLVFKLLDKALCVQSFSCSNLVGYEVTRESLMGGCKQTRLTQGIVEFTMTFKEIDWTLEFNPFQIAETGGGVLRHAFQLVHGTTAGNIIDLSTPEVQVLPGVSNADIDGLLGKSVTCRVLKPFVLSFT